LFCRLIMALLVSSVLSSPAWAGPLEDISTLQKGLRSVRADFRQEKRTELLPRPVKSRGTFYFREGSGVRWVYDGQMVVIYDNRTLYLHYTELDEAEKVNGIAGFSGPLSFNVIELKKDYRIKAVESGDGGIKLVLTPKAPMPFETMSMHFRKSEPFPYEVRVMEAAGDMTVISFVKPELNVNLKKSLFVFKPSRGVKVRERNYN